MVGVIQFRLQPISSTKLKHLYSCTYILDSVVPETKAALMNIYVNNRPNDYRCK